MIFTLSSICFVLFTFPLRRNVDTNTAHPKRLQTGKMYKSSHLCSHRQHWTIPKFCFQVSAIFVASFNFKILLSLLIKSFFTLLLTPRWNIVWKMEMDNFNCTYCDSSVFLYTFFSSCFYSLSFYLTTFWCSFYCINLTFKKISLLF